MCLKTKCFTSCSILYLQIWLYCESVHTIAAVSTALLCSLLWNPVISHFGEWHVASGFALSACLTFATRGELLTAIFECSFICCFLSIYMSWCVDNALHILFSSGYLFDNPPPLGNTTSWYMAFTTFPVFSVKCWIKALDDKCTFFW